MSMTTGPILGKSQTFSLEVFPPKNESAFQNSFSMLRKMGAFHPDFISVTYGAGGSRAGKTIEIASFIQNDLGIDAVAHMTCVGCTGDQLLGVCRELEKEHVDHILALRGDRPADMSDEQYASRDFEHAVDMMNFLHEHTAFHFAGACYPEKHPEAESMEADIEVLLQKQEAGAEFLISQLFFDNTYYYRFLDQAIAKGIRIPAAAGIMPVTAQGQINTTINLAGSHVPAALSDMISKYADDPEDLRKAGIDYAASQINDLLDHGIGHVHLFSMNKPDITEEIIRRTPFSGRL